jgi:lipopolysaccharide biosynthesis glycosyltransferase
MRKASTAICFACDESFFGFAKGLVLSIREHFKSTYDLFFIDLGASAESLEWLEQKGVNIVNFDPDSVVNGFSEREYPRYIGAMICRPVLPNIVPGYEVYIWLDADTWIQEPTSIRSFVGAAQTGANKIAISSTDPWIYSFSHHQIEEFRGYSRFWYEGLFGDAVANTYCDKKILNSGFFALSAKSNIWMLWRSEVERIYARAISSKYIVHMAEQTALNYICYAHENYVEFSSFHNFNCHMAALERHDGRVRRAGDNLYRVGVVHLTLSGRLGADYLERGLLYDEGRYLTRNERQNILRLRHNK